LWSRNYTIPENLTQNDKNFPLVASVRRIENSKLSDVRNDFRLESVAISRIHDTKFTVVGSLTLPTQYRVPLALLIPRKPPDKEATCLLEIYYCETHKYATFRIFLLHVSYAIRLLSRPKRLIEIMRLFLLARGLSRCRV